MKVAVDSIYQNSHILDVNANGENTNYLKKLLSEMLKKTLLKAAEGCFLDLSLKLKKVTVEL